MAEVEARLALELLALLPQLGGVIRVDEQPEGFEWRDGFDGAERMHLPLARVRGIGGDMTFVDAMVRSDLARNPSLDGARLRIELECAARGATYEIWTEDEIRADPTAVRALRVADWRERAWHARVSPSARAAPLPGIVSSVARRLGIEDVGAVGTGFVGRSVLTGIPMVILEGSSRRRPADPLVWRPAPPTAAGRRQGGDSIGDGADSVRAEGPAADFPACRQPKREHG